MPTKRSWRNLFHALVLAFTFRSGEFCGEHVHMVACKNAGCEWMSKCDAVEGNNSCAFARSEESCIAQDCRWFESFDDDQKCYDVVVAFCQQFGAECPASSTPLCKEKGQCTRKDSPLARQVYDPQEGTVHLGSKFAEEGTNAQRLFELLWKQFSTKDFDADKRNLKRIFLQTRVVGNTPPLPPGPPAPPGPPSPPGPPTPPSPPAPPGPPGPPSPPGPPTPPSPPAPPGPPGPPTPPSPPGPLTPPSPPAPPAPPGTPTPPSPPAPPGPPGTPTPPLPTAPSDGGDLTPPDIPLDQPGLTPSSPVLQPPTSSEPEVSPPPEEDTNTAPSGSDSTGSEGIDTAVVVGAVVGGFGGLTLISVIVIYLARNRGMKGLPSTVSTSNNLEQGAFTSRTSSGGGDERKRMLSRRFASNSSTGAHPIQTGIGVLDACLSLATSVANMTQRVIANHAQCERLALRINAMLPLLNALQEHLTPPLDQQQQKQATMLEPVLDQLRDVLEEAKHIIEKWSQRDKSIVSILFSMSTSERYGTKFRDVSSSMTECFNDLTLALQLQMRNFFDRVVGQKKIADRVLDSERINSEDRQDTKEDLKELAEALAEHGQSFEGMSKGQQAELLEQFELHGLDLKELLRQERRRTIEEKTRDLVVPWKDIRIGELIGQGGYAKVYRGYWGNLEIAIKEFHQTQLSKRAKRMVYHEAYILSLLRHPNIAVFYGLVDEQEHFALLMECYGRGSIADALDREDTLPWTWKVSILSNVAEGMVYLHSRPYERIVHGDLKPENVLLNDRGDALISDFGVSRIQSYTNTVAPAAMAMSICYTPPEVFLDPMAHREPSSDVYAFGMFMYAVATQAMPFEGVDPRIVGRLVEDGKRPLVPPTLEKEHPSYVRLMVKCWSQDPKKRPTFQEVSNALKRIQ